ncbi:O-antigen ligase family protein [Exiguobacterium sp. TDN 0502]|uniref:O-antigen ligase family protein n=1 Tax=Exiguobacterium sp. TDN 0502 TaxID=3420731 RepID=UPI003D787F2C
MKINDYNQKTKTLNLLILSMFFLGPMNFFIKQTNILYLDVFINSIFLCGLIFLYIINIDRKIEKDFLVILFFFLITLFFSGIFYSSYLVNWVGLIVIFTLTTLPGYYIGRKITDTDHFFRLIEKVPFPLTVIMLVIFFYKKNLNILRLDDMFISYAILPSVIISTYLLLYKKKMVNIVYILVGLFMIITHGSRGPLLAILVYIILYFLINADKNKIIITFLSLSSLYIYFNFLTIVSWLISVLNKFNYSSRTLYKIIDGSVTSGTGRDSIQEIALNLFKEHPFTGVGIGVERIHIFEGIYLTRGVTDKLSTSYPHNIFIELLAQFGLIGGLLIILFILFIIVKSFNSSNKNEKNLLIILFSITFIELMLSSSYLLSPQFFFYMGVCYSLVVRKRTKQSLLLREKTIDLQVN